MFIEHINISAPAHILEKEKDFLCALFDLTVGFRPAFSRAGYWLYDEKSESQDIALVHLTECNQDRSNELKGYLDHIAFRMADLTSFMEKLNSLSVAFSKAQVPELNLTQLFFQSPSGIALEASFKEAYL